MISAKPPLIKKNEIVSSSQSGARMATNQTQTDKARAKAYVTYSSRSRMDRELLACSCGESVASGVARRVVEASMRMLLAGRSCCQQSAIPRNVSHAND